MAIQPCHLDRAVPNEARDSPTSVLSLFFSSFLQPTLSSAAAFNSSMVLKGTSDVSEPCLCSDEISTTNLCKRRLGSKRSICPRYSCLLLLIWPNASIVGCFASWCIERLVMSESCLEQMLFIILCTGRVIFHASHP